MPDVAGRAQFERHLQTELERAFADAHAAAQQGEEPDWSQTKRRTRDALAAALLLLFGITVTRWSSLVKRIDTDALSDAAEEYALRRSASVADFMLDNMRDELQALLAARGQAVGTESPMTDEEYEAGLDAIFGRLRTERVAATEVTTGASAAEMAAAERYTEETGEYLLAAWNTERDAKVCPICAPLDGAVEDLEDPEGQSWRREFPDGPPAHVACRCFLVYAEKDGSELSESLLENCGTGAGGFKEGNTCATGGSAATMDDDDSDKAAGDAFTERRIKSAEFKDFFGDWENDPDNASKIIGSDGKPLVLLHGTNYEGRIDSFVPHVLTDVLTVDGKEMLVANSWDMGTDETGMPDGIHYAAVSDIKTFGTAEKALEWRLERRTDLKKWALENGREWTAKDEKDDRHIRDLRRLVGKEVSHKKEMRPSGDGIYLTTDPNYSFIANSKQVLPVYANIRNPKFVDQGEVESAGHSFRVEEYKAQGYDGVVFTNDKTHRDLTRGGWGGSPQIVAFYPEQLKSASGNTGAFSRKSRNIHEALLESDCGANAPGGGGFQPGNDCAKGGGGRSKQNKTAAFKRWFGDSKVVDEHGEPLVVYHGTGDLVTEFDLDHPNRKDTGWLGTGVYATTNALLASDYATLKPGSGNVMPLYAKVENPYYATQRDKQRLQLISHSKGREAGRAAADEWTRELVAKGHDGVILDYKPEDVGNTYASKEIVVFSPSGVKSATGNRGTFDPSSANITESLNV